MKSLTSLTFFILLFFFACKQKSIPEEATVKEILAITNEYNKTWETLDMNAVAMFHSHSSFRYYQNMKLSVGSNNEFKKMYPIYISGAKSW